MRATVQKGVALSGADAACVKCHRRSGLGGSEGQNPIRPIAGRLLFSSQGKLERAGRWAIPASSAAVRPPYTRNSLARALREGIDPAGRPLDALMPRYDLSDEEIAQLQAYLEGLSSTAAPGVTDREIHFSTIITPDISSDRRSAMLDVLQGFFRDKNGGTRKETRRREAGSEQMYRAFRTWVLHVWELKGSPETWGAQLAAYYRQQPVFAVIGGIGGASWQPVHAFCEAFEVPCVFPDVDYPDVAGTGYYPLYFTRGVTLEAEVLAKHLLETGPSGGAIVQVYRDHALGRLPAQGLREYLQGKSRKTVIDYPLSEAGRLPVDFLSRLAGNERLSTLVLWLDSTDLAVLDPAAALPDGLEAIYVSASLSVMRRPSLPENWLSKLRMVYPFDLPATREQRLARMNAWLRARNIPLSDERTQANAFFAATVTGDAMSHLGENFSRDYFIERIEQMTQSALSPSIYPHLSLGPGQRFASKGGYVVRFSPGKGGTPIAISEWLIP
ncbi:MAG TPA: cytochrome C [Thiobacillus sp.]|nr:cytochrome C [Thiobacillus sp.]